MKIAASRLERNAVALFALARTAFCAYRAATQSITVDEAGTYLNFGQHWGDIWNNYDPNNHVLYSILAQLSIRALHVSEFSLRLPSVLAGFFLILGVHRILAATVPSAVTRWIALAGVGLAPLLLDFSVAARGYVLGLALLMWAVYFSIQKRDLWAGVFAGLSVATTLHLAFAAIGLAGAPLVLGRGGMRTRVRRTNRVAEPAAVVFLLLWFPILRQTQLSQFYLGLPTIQESLRNFVSLTLRAYPGHGGWLGSGAFIRTIEYFVLPPLVVFVIAVATRSFRLTKDSRQSLTPALTLVAALCGILLSHFFFGLSYPVDRLWLYLFVLLAAAWAIAVSQVPVAWVRRLNGGLAAILVAQMLTQLHVRYFTVWQFDAGIKQAAQVIRDDVRGLPPGSVSVSATWYNYPAMEFYRRAYRITALQPIERHDPTELSGYDYYVLNLDHENPNAAPLAGATPLFKDDLSGVVLVR